MSARSSRICGSPFFLVLACLIVAAGTAQAATVSQSDPFPEGIVYRWTVADMTDSDSTGPLVRHVGALSFEDPVNFADPNGYFGWTHTSDWLQLELLAPAVLEIKLDRTAGVPNGSATAGDQLYPAFAIWSGVHNAGGDDHVYNNHGNFSWAPELGFLGNEPNASGLASVSKSFSLPAGDYSIVFAGNPPQHLGSGRQGYTATLSTQPIPEPAGWALACAGAVALAFARRVRR